MKRLVLVLWLWPALAFAHVGSPDVFFDGDAGAYHLSVAIRMPKVIPGVATIEVRTDKPDVTGMTVVPMRLTGPGSELPPTPDPATRTTADAQFFTADLWLMERGSLQVRIAVEGARGKGTLAIPVPAAALETKTMDRALGGLLFGLMLLLALAAVGIATAAARDAALPPGTEPDDRSSRRARIAMGVASVLVLGVLWLGNKWWSAEAADYASWVQKPWQVEAKVEPCRIAITIDKTARLLPDHGHDMHLFLLRMPGMDQLAHLHPTLAESGLYAATLPSLPAGKYKLYADVVVGGGFPITGVADIDLPEQRCDALTGDDAAWSARPQDVIEMTSPAKVKTGAASPLKFHVKVPIEPYMGMAGHVEIVKTDGSVFAHIHPSGTVAMPALELAGSMPMAMDMPGMEMPPPPQDISFPYGFPSPGDYRVFIQVKIAGVITTAAFDVHVN